MTRTRSGDASLWMRMAFAAGLAHTGIQIAPWARSIIEKTSDWKLWEIAIDALAISAL